MSELSPPRMSQLDGLRGLAAVAVIFAHTAEDDLLHTHRTGGYAVRMFFVLSGFLITGILVGARRKAELLGASRGGVLKAFYARRTLRIFPVYYLTLILFVALSLPGLAENFWAAATYTINVRFALDQEWRGAGQHLWSLAVEEQFYLLWPTLVLFLPARWLPPLFVGCVALAPLYRAAAILWTDSTLRATLPLPGCLDCLAVGAVVSWIHTDRPDLWRWLRWPVLLAGIGLIVLAEQGDKLTRVVCDTSGIAFVSAWLVAQTARGLPRPIGPILQSRPLVYLGTISYGLYLYHMYLLPMAGGGSGLGAFFALFAVTVVVASLSWFLFERPINNLKDRFPYVTQTAARPH